MGTAAALALLLAPPAAAQEGADAAFRSLAAGFLDDLFATHPVLATRVGDHRHDAELDDLSPEAMLARVGALRQYQARLRRIDPASLSPENQVDAEILADHLEGALFQLTELREPAWNPLFYGDLLGGGLQALIAREFAPWPERLRPALGRLRQIPRLTAQAASNLTTAPRMHVEAAIGQNGGTISLIRDELEPRFRESPQLAADLRAAAVQAIAALEAYGAWLRDDLLPRAGRDFRLGAALYDRKLRFALDTDMPREEILRRAEREFQRVRREMYDVAREIYRGRHPYTRFPDSPDDAYLTAIIRAALGEATTVHPERGELLDAAGRYLEEATALVRGQGLVSLPDEPIRIVEMPAFLRGAAVAACDAPGPLDRGLATYYRVSPIPEAWPPERVEAFLREHNAYFLRERTIHEAMPGRCVQLAISKRFPSALRAVLASETFIEGWATYAEKVMVDAGYLAGDPRMRLTRLKAYLGSIVGAILDPGIHTGAVNEEEAMRLLVEGAFLEEAEAAPEWRRACLTATRLSTSFVGLQEHLDLRREIEAQWGEAFLLRDYHDLLLAHGSPPIKQIRRLLLP